MSLIDAHDLDLVDWSQPINDGSDLARGLRGLWIAGACGAWKSNEWFDISGHNRHGTLTSMDPATDWTGRSPRAGYGSLNHAGTAQWVTTGTLNYIGTQDFTAWCWFRTTATGFMYMLGGGGLGSSTPGFGLAVNYTAAGGVYGFIEDTARLIFTGVGSGYNDGNWHLYIASFNRAGNWVPYLDGKAIGSQSISARSGDIDGSTLYIGRISLASGYFSGDIAEAGVISGRAFSAVEAAAFYAESLAGYPNLLNRAPTPVGFVAAVGGGGNRRRRFFIGAA